MVSYLCGHILLCMSEVTIVDQRAMLSYLWTGYLARFSWKSTYLSISFVLHIAKCHFISNYIAELLNFYLSNFIWPTLYIHHTKYEDSPTNWGIEGLGYKFVYLTIREDGYPSSYWSSTIGNKSMGCGDAWGVLPAVGGGCLVEGMKAEAGYWLMSTRCLLVVRGKSEEIQVGFLFYHILFHYCTNL